MNKLSLLCGVFSFFLIGCTGTFQSGRRYSNRQYVRIHDSIVINEPVALVAKHSLSFEKTKEEHVPLRTSVELERLKIIPKKMVPKGTVFTQGKKSAQLNSHSPPGRFERKGKPTLNILAFILTMTYFLMIAGLVLGILGVALNRPLRGLGIASICIFVAGMIAFALVIFLVIL